MTNLESLVKDLHHDFYYKEYTYSRTQFAPELTEIELADNIVWLDDIFHIFQMKERFSQDDDSIDGAVKWFNNKVLGKAVRQIKNTIFYLEKYKEIRISNDKEHFFNLHDAPLSKAKLIIIYADESGTLPEKSRRQKFHISKSVGLIHLLHVEDYTWICRYLFTPCEINEYLSFREQFFHKQPVLNELPEQYVLCHFFAGNVDEPITSRYMSTLQNLVDNSEEFDFSSFIDNFSRKIIAIEGNVDNAYYTIQKELAKLARNELKAFKERFEKAWDDVKNNEFNMPYRIVVPRTGCGFIIVPLQIEQQKNWKNALHNCTIGHKYDSKIDKCIGLVLFKNSSEDQEIQAFWQYVEFHWEYNEEIEEILRKDSPLRPIKAQKVYRYHISE